MNTEQRLSKIKAKKYVKLHLEKELAKLNNEITALEDLD